MTQPVSLLKRQKVVVTEVTSNGCFFVQLDIQDAYNLDKVSNEISQLVASNQKLGQGFFPSPGTQCFAQSADGVWYRALYLKPDSETNCTVYYVDYGNTECNIPLVRLFPPVTDYFRTPYQAVCCQLADFLPNEGKWNEETVQALRENVLNQEIPAVFHGEITNPDSRFITQNIPCYSTSLYWDDTEDDYTVAQELVAMGLGTHLELQKPQITSSNFPDPSVPPPLINDTSANEYHYLELEVNQKYRVYISYAESPDVVWCQLADHTTEIETMVAHLQDHMTKQVTKLVVEDPQKTVPPIGEPCCVIFSQDGLWCRGVVEDVDTAAGAADILFVDFGNIESIPFSELHVLPPEFLNTHAQAISFSMSGITCPAGIWSSEAIARFEELYTDQELLCDVVAIDQNGYPSVRLKDVQMGSDLGEVLIAEQFAINTTDESDNTSETVVKDEPSTEAVQRKKMIHPSYQYVSVPIGVKSEVYITSIDSLNLFYTQLSDQFDALTVLMKLIGEYCNSPEAQPIPYARPGLPVLAQYSFDKEWYRAAMIPPEEPLNEWGVIFVDYGNTEKVNMHLLKSIPPSFLQLPAQAVKCCLDGFPLSRSTDEGIINVFSHITADQSLECVVRKRVDEEEGDGGLHLVKIFKDGKNILENLKEVKPTPPSESDSIVSIPILKVPTDQRVSVCVCFIEALTKFACQLSDNYNIVHQLVSQMNIHYQSQPRPTLVKPVVGSCCAALFSQDQQWYRAQVIKILPDNAAEVLFVDYGNTEAVSLDALCELAEEFLAFPNQAILCSLDGFAPSLASPELVDKFEQDYLDKKLESEFLLSNPSSVTPIVPCKLYDPETNTSIAKILSHIGSQYQNTGLNPEPKPFRGDTVESQKHDSLQVGYLSREQSPNLQKAMSPVGNRPSPQRNGLDLLPRSRNSSRSRQSSDTPLIQTFKPPLSSLMAAFVSYVNSPSEFYLQPLLQAEQLESLMNDLYVYYSEQRKGFPIHSPYVGIHCCVPYTDGSYYRGIVTKLDNQNAAVFYLDYGNVDVVPVKDLFSLSTRFTALPAQAIKCSLSGITMATGATPSCDWSNDCIYNMQEAILEQEVQVLFMNQIMDDFYEVSINVRSQNLSDLLIEAGLVVPGVTSKLQTQRSENNTGKKISGVSTPQSFTPSSLTTSSSTTSTPPQTPSRSGGKIPSEIIPVRREVEVVITEITPKCQIICQVLENQTKLDKIIADINKYIATQPKPISSADVRKGRYVLGQFTLDDNWYRAKILSTDKQISVVYIDFGNQEVLPLSRMRTLAHALYNIPAQAIRCQLDGTEDQKPSPGAAKVLQDELLEVECVMKVLKNDKSGKHIVDLTIIEDGRDVMQWATTVGLYKPPSSRSRHSTSSSSSSAVSSGRKNSPSVGKTPLNTSTNSDLVKTKSSLKISSHIPKLTCQTGFAGYIVYIESPVLFYCQPADSATEMDKLMSDLSDHYKNLPSPKNTQTPIGGEFAAALYSEDSQWYRVQILEIFQSSQQANVCFIDFGNSELVSFTNIRPLNPKFATLAAQGVQCRLASIQPIDSEWSDESFQLFSELVGDSLVMMKLKEIGEFYLVVSEAIIESGTNLTEEMVKQGQAQPSYLTPISTKSSSLSSVASSNPVIMATSRDRQISDDSIVSSSTTKSSERSSVLAPFKIREKEIHSIYISYIDEKSDTFWVQPAEQTGELFTLTENLSQSYIPPLTHLPDPNTGDTCCAQFSEDDRWYRAVVEGPPSSQGIPVFFVDYGNSDVLPLKRICILKKGFQSLPQLAIPCILEPGSNIPLMDSEDPIDLQFVRKISNDSVWEVRVVCSEPSKSPVPRPHSSVIVPTLHLDVGGQHEVYIVYTESPSNFWCQLADGNSALEELMALLADYYTDHCPQVKLEVEMYCVAQYSENNTWYRAKILDIENEQITVHFIDYGNQEVLPLNKVAGIDPQFLSLPCQAFQCSLLQSSSGQFTEEQLESFFSLNFEEESFRVTLCEQLPKQVWYVQLHNEIGLNINDIFTSLSAFSLMISQSSETTPTFPILHYSPGEKLDVFVTCVNTPDSFYCQPLELASDLDDLMTDIATYMTEHPINAPISLKTLNINQSCLARYASPNDWYRAEIADIDVAVSQILVRYVDYGNMARLKPEQIAPLPPQFLPIPAQALHCSAVNISSISQSWSPEIIESFVEVVHEEDQYMLTINSFSSSLKYIVDVHLAANTLKQVDLSFLRVQLNDMGMGMSIASNQTTPSTLIHISESSDDITNLVQNTSDTLEDLPGGGLSALKGSKTPTTDLEESEGESATIGEPLIHAPCKLSLASDEVVNVLVVFVQDPSLLYIQRIDCKRELDSLSAEINQYCSDFADKLIQENYHPGDFVLAQYDADQMWYRALVKNVLPDSLLEVQFIDYGNTEVVSAQKMIMCSGNFLELPVQAIPCSLAQVPIRENWPDEYKQIIDELVEEREMKASVVVAGGHGMSATVTLHDVETGYDISQKVLEHLQEECEAGVVAAHVGIDKKNVLSVKEKKDGEDDSKVQENENGDIDQKKHENEITVDELTRENQEEENIKDFKRQSDEMTGENIITTEEKLEDMKDEITDKKLKEVEEECTEVTEEKEVEEEHNEVIEEKELEEEHNEVTEEKEVEEEYNEVSEENEVEDEEERNGVTLEKEVEDEHNKVTEEKEVEEERNEVIEEKGVEDELNEECNDLTEENVEGINQVRLEEMEENNQVNENEMTEEKLEEINEVTEENKEEIVDNDEINIQLEETNDIQNLLTKPSPLPVTKNLHVGSKYEAYLADIFNPFDFVCQLSADSDTLEAITSILNQLYNSATSEKYAITNPPVAGELVCAQYTKDDQFYRAKVINVIPESESYEIEFVDFGNVDTVSFDRLRCLDPQLVTHSPLAFKCGLFGLPEDHDVSDHFVGVLVDKILSCTGDDPVMMEIMGINESGCYDVKLVARGVCINDVIVKMITELRNESDDRTQEEAILLTDLHNDKDTTDIVSGLQSDSHNLSQNESESGQEIALEPKTVEEQKQDDSTTSLEILNEQEQNVEALQEENKVDDIETNSTVSVATTEAGITIATNYLRQTFKSGDQVKVVPQHCDSLDYIHCRVINEEMIESISDAISAEAYAIEDKRMAIEEFELVPGLPLLAFSRKYDSWQRAEVVESNKILSVIVKYVDCGTNEELPLTRLKLLSPHLASLSPPLLITCQLPHLLETDLVPQHGFQDEAWELEWPESCIDYFWELSAEEKSLTAEIIAPVGEQPGCFVVNLITNQSENDTG